MNCWFWNIDRDRQDFITRELQNGRLRQGWGYNENLDLRKIQKKRQSGEPLTDREQAAWSRCKDMLNRIAPGDLAVVKNVPTSDHFTLVRVTGDYEFEMSDENGGQGHILPVEVIGAYNKNAEGVPTPMVRALNRERHPIRRTLKHQEKVENLTDVDPQSKRASEPEPFKEMIDRLGGSLATNMNGLIRDELTPRSAERLILEMLRSDGLNVDWTAGPGEQGADLSTEMLFGYGLSTDVAVQVKFHRGTEEQLRGLEQIEEAFEKRGVDAGLLVTFADELSDRVENRLAELRRTHRENVEILYGEDLYRRLSALVANPDYSIEES